MFFKQNPTRMAFAYARIMMKGKRERESIAILANFAGVLAAHLRSSRQNLGLEVQRPGSGVTTRYDQHVPSPN